ncbi:MAG: hypothetical protein LBJ41_01425 [Treponema sp.]|nr:hypothetical protein [Treponema sp.]
MIRLQEDIFNTPPQASRRFSGNRSLSVAHRRGHTTSARHAASVIAVRRADKRWARRLHSAQGLLKAGVIDTADMHTSDEDRRPAASEPAWEARKRPDREPIPVYVAAA